jgi:glycosyltransferase
MKISIITVCYNRSSTIEQSILSVLQQDYPNIEYIIIDGNSNDGTKEIIAAYGDRISKYISEKDKGMYDAINKGVKLATGDVIGLMHSDDTFYDNEVVSKIVKAFQEHDSIDGVYGDGIYVTNDAEERLVRNRIGGEYNVKRIEQGWLPLHPTVYFKRSCIEQYGLYNLDFKIASDTEFLIRYLYKHEVKMHYLNSYMVKMKMGGLSTDYKRAVEVLKEDYKIYKFHNMNPFSAVFQKKMQALQQYLKK